MRILEILQDIEIIQSTGDLSGTVDVISYDSRTCGRQALFVAVRGLQYDGHDYIEDAICCGATYVMHEHEVERREGVTYIQVADSRRALGIAAGNFYGHPSKKLRLIGITGTNGKTTITYILESILKAAGIDVGIIGTINYRYGGEVIEAPNTTPESLDLQYTLKRMVDAGITHVVMEVSSHAIDLARVDNCEYDIGVFTNLSEEHLDYHHTTDNYFLVKKRFFDEIMKGRDMVVNGDDSWGKKLLDEVGGPVTTFGIAGNWDVRATEFDLSIHGIETVVEISGGSCALSSSMTGKFNLYNILAAVAVSRLLGLPMETIRAGIAAVATVPGRLERISGTDEPAIFIDYAHTEDALRKVLENLAEFNKGRIVTVFGCGGDRDRSKRPLMGRAATELSDLSIVTSDNPRGENPLSIIEAIERGIERRRVKRLTTEEIAAQPGIRGYAVIPDRREAIELAVSVADSDDIVLIAGKGHEDYQIIGNRRISFDDKVVARESLDLWRLRGNH